jgi:hypothetical protein
VGYDIATGYQAAATEIQVMRAIILAASALALLVTGAHAQRQGTPPPKEELRPGEQPKPVVDEKKYKSAVDFMGDQTQKYDPWGGIRDKPAEKGKPR